MGKKDKFVWLDNLELALVHQKLCNNLDKYKIPYFVGEKSVNESRIYSLNLLVHDGNVNINKIKYVKITVPKSISDNVKISKYTYGKKKIKRVKTDTELFTTESGSLLIPIEIFYTILREYKENHTNGNVVDTTKLSSILHFTQSAYSIKLLNKDKKVIGYALQ